jgi:hypothetical protein
VTETLEWKTDVLQSPTGAEQRISRRLSPRRTFEFTTLVHDTGRQRFEYALAGLCRHMGHAGVSGRFCAAGSGIQWRDLPYQLPGVTLPSVEQCC